MSLVVVSLSVLACLEQGCRAQNAWSSENLSSVGTPGVLAHAAKEAWMVTRNLYELRVHLIEQVGWEY